MASDGTLDLLKRLSAATERIVCRHVGTCQDIGSPFLCEQRCRGDTLIRHKTTADVVENGIPAPHCNFTFFPFADGTHPGFHDADLEPKMHRHCAGGIV